MFTDIYFLAIDVCDEIQTVEWWYKYMRLKHKDPNSGIKS